MGSSTGGFFILKLLASREDALEKAHALLAERDQTIGNLEADVLGLKAHTGDAEIIAVIKRELSDQVTHMRALHLRLASSLFPYHGVAWANLIPCAFDEGLVPRY